MFGLGEWIRRTLDLRQGEAPLVLRAGGVLFGLIAGHTLLETARDALFLGKLPPSQLSIVYALLAVLSLVVVKLVTAFASRFGLRNVLVITLMGASFGTTLLYLLPESREVAFVLYLWSALIGSMLVLQFWALAGELMTSAQGKRLFGPLAAGGVLGAVMGASAAAVIVAFTDVTILLVIAAGLFLVTSVLVLGFPSDELEDEATAPRPAAASMSELRQSPYLFRMGILVAAVTAAVLIGDYLFKSTAARSMPAADLPGFLARYYAILNLASLFVQLVVSSRLIRIVGVINAASLLPLTLFATSVGVVLSSGGLTFVAVARGVDGAFRHSLYRVSQELMWMPVPERLRVRAKAFFDAVMVRGVQALAAAGLFALSMDHMDRPVLLGLGITGLSAVAVMAAMSLRSHYLELFRSMLAGGAADPAGEGFELDLNSAEMVMEALSSRETSRVVAALELLFLKGRGGLIPSLILYHESPEVLERALEYMPSLRRRDWVPLAERLLDHAAAPVRAAAVRALTLTGEMTGIENRLLDVSPAVRAQAAFSMLAALNVEEPLGDQRIQDLLEVQGPAGHTARSALLEAIAARGDDRWIDVVLQVATDEDPRLNPSLAAAATRLRDPRFIRVLSRRLVSGEGRFQIRQALVSYGEPALEYLAELLRDPRSPPRLRLHIPRSFTVFRNQRAADLLVKCLSEETSGAVRFKALRALGRLAEEDRRLVVTRDAIIVELHRNLVELFRLKTVAYPLRELEDRSERAKLVRGLLIDLLEDKVRQAEERAFRFLKLIHRGEDLLVAYGALHGGDKKSRATAAEYLDALTADYVGRGEIWAESRALLRALLDDLPPRTQIERTESIVGVGVLDTAAALKLLAGDRDNAVVNVTLGLGRLSGLFSEGDPPEAVERVARMAPQAFPAPA